MRHIGNLPDEKQARTFSDHLLANGIRSEYEPDNDGTWMIWIKDEDHVAEAQAKFGRFRTDPNAAEFHGAEAGATRAREAEAEDLANYRKRIRSRRSVFPKFGGHGIGVLTYVLILLCLVTAFYTGLDQIRNEELLRGLFISDPSAQGFLPEVRSGEVWRLITPIFIHFSLPHIVFNLLWLFQLGCMIEARQGASYLAFLVMVTGILANIAQYLTHGPSFGGMSGVVYALAGYVWIRGKFDRTSGVGLDPQSVTWMLVWLVVCYTGLVGNIANTAHLVGLLSGMAWGRIAAYFAMRNPK